MNSIIISAVAVKSSRNRTGIDELNTTALAEPIVITLQHNDATHVGPTCAFLNEQEVQMGNGRWLTEGCKVNEQRSDVDTTVCECSHLTSFAILTSPAGPPVSCKLIEDKDVYINIILWHLFFHYRLQILHSLWCQRLVSPSPYFVSLLLLYCSLL